MNKNQSTTLKVRYKQFYVEGWDKLLIKLKKHGGEMIVPMPEPPEHVQWLLDDGRIFDSTKLKLKKGEPRRCHENASWIWAENEQLQLVTGYALDGDDKLWMQHSWVWNPSKGQLIETIVPKKKYFGAALNDVQALKFAFENVPDFTDPKKIPQPMLKRVLKFHELPMHEKISQYMKTHGY